MIGARFGRLVVVRLVRSDSHWNKHWLCRCDCGTEKEIVQHNLPRITSCGCFRREDTKRRFTKHAMSASTEYRCWFQMQQRCYNANRPDYDDYGGRGITVCARWLGEGGFEHFLADMGKKPAPHFSIDRFPNNDGNYEPGNCRWATPKQQANNRRNRGFNKWHPKPQKQRMGETR